MKLTKALPAAAGALCIPGVALRAMHVRYGFDMQTSLPITGSMWMWCLIALLVAGTALYAVLAAPLRGRRTLPFEQLLGTQRTSFRLAAALAGLLLIAGGLFYLYLTLTVAEQDAASWARALELVYCAVTVICGACVIVLAKAQGGEIDSKSAALTLVPLLWSCLHLLVNYRMTSVDPKLPSFAFGLAADIMIVFACYHLARLLYGRPRPDALAFFSAAAITIAVSDFGGVALGYLMGADAFDWTSKMLLRSGLSVAACVLLAAELAVICSRSADMPAQPAATPDGQPMQQSE
nr:hypothetical protein [uncultured Agathobaculum sp.]